MSIYQEKGFQDRDQYLECVSDEFQIELEEVEEIAFELGPEEDFSGLIAELESRS